MSAARFAAFWILFTLALAPLRGGAQQLDFHAPASAVDPSTTAVIHDLAGRILPVYQNGDLDRYLADLSALQMVSANYTGAFATRQNLRDRRRSADPAQPISAALVYDIYAHARAIEAENRVPFAQAFARVYGEVVAHLDDQESYELTRLLNIPVSGFQQALQNSFDRQRATDTIPVAEAVNLIWTYLAFDVYRSISGQVGALNAESDRQRFTSDAALIQSTDGTKISALIVRPKNPSKPLPTLLEFTIYDSQNAAKECAAHGYVGVVAYTRGEPAGAGVPYQNDGNDARAVVNWIAAQPWSDGRVGMYGSGYSGFTPWAAAKHLPLALRAIATSASSAPGIDVPMAGGIFQNSAYRWILYVGNTDTDDEKKYYDDSLWLALDRNWYTSGRRYRELGELYGKHSPLFIRWLNHPSYDRYWQSMVPYRKEFAHIDIPVLAMTGYYAGSEPGTLYYFTQHHRFDAHADHTLVIGPYDDSVMQRGPLTNLQGYQVDPVALVDFRELQYQWFDYIFKGGAKPSLLKDRVNYELMGANEWRHAPSIEAMAAAPMRFYLDAIDSGDGHRLSQHKPSKVKFVQQTVDLADRSDAGWTAPHDIISQSLANHNRVMFVSDKMSKSAEFNGLFSGRLDFTVNKMDVDLNVTLYELLANGDYVRLFDPTHEFRASYAKDRVHRRLLKAGERQVLAFKSERMTSRQLQAGSRLVMVLGVNKRPDREINYGTGNDVSEDTIEEGKIPLKIRWYGDSYIEIPIRR